MGLKENQKLSLAYLTGVALGDGNLSNPNGRAVRLRITCDLNYPHLIENIIQHIKIILPNNKVSTIKRQGNCLDISSYSNKWQDWLGWGVGKGTKYDQKVKVPKWVFSDKKYIIMCLKGLIETDGSVYEDRGYKMVNFVTTIPNLSKDFIKLSEKIGFYPKKYKIKFKDNNKKDRFNIRISKDVQSFIEAVGIDKS